MARVAFPTTPFGTKMFKMGTDPASEKLIAWKVSEMIGNLIRARQQGSEGNRSQPRSG